MQGVSCSLRASEQPIEAGASQMIGVWQLATDTAEIWTPWVDRQLLLSFLQVLLALKM